jgi:phosphatidylserine/phosphatidylglycerophosphate/cardiolipin synthase-like enzyme
MLLRRRPVALSVVAAMACITPLFGFVPSASADQVESTSSPSASPSTNASATPGASTAPEASPTPEPSTPPETAAKAKVAAKAEAVGKPPQNNAARPGTVMNYPNRSSKERTAIRRRILNTINSTWGGPRDKYHAASAGNGTIRMTTWTFFDMGIAQALARAHKRGVSVQVLAARTPNKGSRAMGYLRSVIHTKRWKTGHIETADRWSFLRTCRSSCRGSGGTPHSKYYLFTNVGSRHRPHITFSTSMNLTMFAVTGQWNEATITWNAGVYRAFLKTFKESRPDRRVRGSTYRVYRSGAITSIFFPKSRPRASNDPVMNMLGNVHCKGATAGGDARHRTQIRIIQYAMYDKRGVWIAKRLRALWKAGCNIRLIYSAMSSPPFKILRAGSGRGPIPMKRSVLRTNTGFINKYNHNKWMTITGRYGSSRKAFVVMSGSANWGNAAFKGDEQMVVVRNASMTRAHMKSFGITWRQKSSESPHPGTIVRGTKVIAGKNDRPGETPEKLVFGEGAYKYLPED